MICRMIMITRLGYENMPVLEADYIVGSTLQTKASEPITEAMKKAGVEALRSMDLKHDLSVDIVCEIFTAMMEARNARTTGDAP